MAKAKSSNKKTIKASTAPKKAKSGETTTSTIQPLPNWENGVTPLNADNMTILNNHITALETNKADKSQFITIESSSQSAPVELSINNIYYYTGNELYINLSSANLVNLGDKITLIINNISGAAGYLFVSSTDTPKVLDISAGRYNEFIFTCIKKDNNNCFWIYSDNEYEFNIETN